MSEPGQSDPAGLMFSHRVISSLRFRIGENFWRGVARSSFGSLAHPEFEVAPSRLLNYQAVRSFGAALRDPHRRERASFSGDDESISRRLSAAQRNQQGEERENACFDR